MLCASLPDDSDTHQVIGVSIESINNGSQNSRVAFLTDEVYRSSEAIEPERLYANECATISIGWVIQTKNLTFLDSLSCINTNEFNSLDYRSIQNKLRMQQYNHFWDHLCKLWMQIVDATEVTKATPTSLTYAKNPVIRIGRVSSRNRRASETCINVPGDFNCVGDKTRAIMIGLGSGFGILVLVAGILMLRKFIKKRRITQRKKKFFKRNGGLLLQQQLDTNKGILEKTRVFTSSELEKATEIFSENRILGQGGQGTVYKGMLVDGKTVAVKKSKAVDEDKLEELSTKSSFSHRSTIDMSSSSGDVSTNVLLDEKYRAKVSDFGTSRTVTVDHTHWTTVISGTVGYVDPEYYGSSQYTDKSDVYSFGVILVELITGEKPVITLPDSQEIRGLADHFRAAMKENK
ncbi:hypothetical protein YC2023_058188 [Brassica napus]